MAPCGMALLPYFSISDRATIAYEVIARSPSAPGPAALAYHALERADQSSPAVLIVPFPPHLSVAAVFQQNFARVLRSAVRTGDDVVRFGGEEFLILLHDSGLEGALRVAESIRHAVATMPRAEGAQRVTASIGVAVFPPNGPSLEDAVRAADLAMYRAKAQGRNRVVAASQQGIPSDQNRLAV